MIFRSLTKNNNEVHELKEFIIKEGRKLLEMRFVKHASQEEIEEAIQRYEKELEERFGIKREALR